MLDIYYAEMNYQNIVQQKAFVEEELLSKYNNMYYVWLH